MSWVDACKAAFKVKADALIFRSIKNRNPPNRLKVMRQLSKESGLPVEILKRWYYEKEQEMITGEQFTMPLCKKCNKNPIRIGAGMMKPTGAALTPTVDLCSTCHRRFYRKQKEVTNEKRN